MSQRRASLPGARSYTVTYSRPPDDVTCITAPKRESSSMTATRSMSTTRFQSPARSPMRRR
jgi:hypothetical protein